MKIQIDTAELDIAMEQNRHSVVVVFPDADRAKWYIDNCLEFYVRVIVVSMDGVYPEHPTLANKVKEIWQDEGARFVVFGAWAIEDNPPAGTIWNMDAWAVNFSRKRTSIVHRAIADLEWANEPVRLARMIELFANMQNNRNSKLVSINSVKSENHDFNLLPNNLRYLIS